MLDFYGRIHQESQKKHIQENILSETNKQLAPENCELEYLFPCGMALVSRASAVCFKECMFQTLITTLAITDGGLISGLGRGWYNQLAGRASNRRLLISKVDV